MTCVVWRRYVVYVVWHCYVAYAIWQRYIAYVVWRRYMAKAADAVWRSYMALKFGKRRSRIKQRMLHGDFIWL